MTVREYGDYDAVVLAGGAAKRLGGADKPGLRVGGRSLLDRVLGACADAGRTVVVGSRRPTARPVRWAREQPPGGGPLAALHAGVREVSSPVVLALSADLPFLTPETVRALRTALDGPGEAPRPDTGSARPSAVGRPAGAVPAGARRPGDRPDAASAPEGHPGTRPAEHRASAERSAADRPPAGQAAPGHPRADHPATDRPATDRPVTEVPAGPGAAGRAPAADRPDGVLLTDADGRDQPLVAVYRTESLRRELALIASEHGGLAHLPLRLLTGGLTLRRLPAPDPHAVFDCDTWDHLAAARARIRDHGRVLDEWISEVKAELGIELDVDTAGLLDLARDAAHGVTRPAAPLTTFLVGYAAGMAGGSPEQVTANIQRAVTLAARWAAESGADSAEDPGKHTG
ncbi:DUF6457 domain-containing protein [Streptomyces zingiberis]|uniref:NTP transferase domain-containing protein n=1 Tax=Streptomyces zingiberis TaxID=2053010 RepID=A0ABX1BU61_9ACTN|nr:DUF6457 domain-containing protein [Streptomyces zingiberis]NJP99286.1 NTP transferase domain-containing protein [Streptomyces zingiberis]